MDTRNNIIEILNERHRLYLETEGKWLGSGFENVFVNGEPQLQNIKMSIFYMLPSLVKIDVMELMNGN